MKHIKIFENNIVELIQYQVYIFKPNNTPVCYIGNNGAEFPSLCLILKGNEYRNDNYDFIDWIQNIGKSFEPLNIDIKDYIIKKNIVAQIINSIDKKYFASGPSGKDSKLIRDFKKYLLSDSRIEMLVDVEKYNL